MKRRYRWISLSILGLLMITGCAPQVRKGNEGMREELHQPIHLVIWHYYNGPQKTAFDAMLAKFNETVGVREEIVVEALSQGNIVELTKKVINAAQKKPGAGNVPDIFAAYADTAYAVDRLGLVAELDSYITPAELSQYRAEYVEEGRFDEKESLKIFPVAKATELLMVNETDWNEFATETGAQLTEMETWEGLQAIAERYYVWTDQKTPQPEDGKAFFGRDAMANYMLVGCRQLGMEIFSVKGGQVTLQLDRAVLRKLWNAYYIPYINGYYTASGRFRSDDIKMGNIVAMVGSTTGVTYFPDCVNLSDSEGYPITCLMQAAPRFAQGKPVVVQQGAGMVVTKSDPQTERAATTFLKWFTQSQRNAEFAIAAGYLPVKRDVQHPQVLESIWKEWEGVHLDERTRLAYTTAMRQMEICSLYAGKAFSGGVEARDILEHALQDKAQEDRAQVEAHIAAGMPREEAVLSYCTDENFEAWYQSLHGMLQQVIHEGSFSK